MSLITIPELNCDRKMSATLMSPDIRRFGSRLFDQQMWCWGQDIRHSAGNLLIEYGLTRLPPQCQRRAQSCYDWASDYRQMRLWGFAIWLSHDLLGTMLIRRSDFRPQFTAMPRPAPLAWLPDGLPVLGWPTAETEIDQTRWLLADLFGWIGDYERWAIGRIGTAGRQAMIDAWPQRRKGMTLAAPEMAGAWQELAGRVNASSVRCMST